MVLTSSLATATVPAAGRRVSRTCEAFLDLDASIRRLSEDLTAACRMRVEVWPTRCRAWEADQVSEGVAPDTAGAF